MIYVQNGKFVSVNHNIVPDPSTYPKVVQYMELSEKCCMMIGEDGSVWSVHDDKAIQINDLHDMINVSLIMPGSHTILFLITKDGSAVVANVCYHANGIMEIFEKQIYEYPARVLYHDNYHAVCSDGVMYSGDIERDRDIQKISGSLVLHKSGWINCVCNYNMAKVCHISRNSILTDNGNLYNTRGDVIMHEIPNPGSVIQIHRTRVTCGVLYNDHTLAVYRKQYDSGGWSIIDTITDVDCISGQIDRRVPTKGANKYR